MFDTVESVNFPTECLNFLKILGMPLYCFQPKIGSLIILRRNSNSPKFFNRIRVIMKELSNYIMKAELMTETNKIKTVFIPRIPFTSTKLPSQFKRVQYPIK